MAEKFPTTKIEAEVTLDQKRKRVLRDLLEQGDALVKEIAELNKSQPYKAGAKATILEKLTDLMELVAAGDEASIAKYYPALAEKDFKLAVQKEKEADLLFDVVRLMKSFGMVMIMQSGRSLLIHMLAHEKSGADVVEANLKIWGLRQVSRDNLNLDVDGVFTEEQINRAAARYSDIKSMEKEKSEREAEIDGFEREMDEETDLD